MIQNSPNLETEQILLDNLLDLQQNVLDSSSSTTITTAEISDPYIPFNHNTSDAYFISWSHFQVYYLFSPINYVFTIYFNPVDLTLLQYVRLNKPRSLLTFRSNS